MENEILIAENVEIDMETLAMATSPRYNTYMKRVAGHVILYEIIKALSPADRKKLEEYRNQ